MKKIMSNIKILSILSFVSLFIFTSCGDLALPSKVQVIASPSYTVPAGSVGSETFVSKLDELMSEEKLSSLFGGNENIGVYKYMTSADDENMRYLLKFGMSIPLSSAAGDGDMNIDDLLNIDLPSIGYEDDGTTLSPLFEIPEISPEMNIDPIELTWEEIGSSAINPIGMDFSGVTVNVDGVYTLAPEISLCSDPSAGLFDSITFSSTENSVVTVSFGQLSGTTATVSDFCFKKTTGAAIGTVTKPNANLLSSTESDRQCSVDLKDCTLPEEFIISMKITLEGASGSLSASQDFSSIKVAKVNGFTKSDLSINFPSMDSISLGDSLPFKQATFAGTAGGTTGGKLDVALSGLPSGVTLSTFKFSMEQAIDNSDGTYDGFAINDSNSNNVLTDTDGDGTYTLGFDGQNFNSKPISCGGSLSVSASNATIEFPLTITPTPRMTISKFSSVKILESTINSAMGGTGLNQSIEQELAGIQNTVKAMWFDTSSSQKGFGIKVVMENALPMDVSFNVDSKILNLTDAPYSFPKGATTTEYIITQAYDSQSNALDLSSLSIYSDVDGDGTPNPVFDIDMQINLGASAGVITLNDVVPGSSYGMGVKIEPVLDIKEVKVDLSTLSDGTNLSYSGSFPQPAEDGSAAEPIDISMIGNILGDDLEITGTEVYAYIDDKGLLGENTIDAKFDAIYTETDSEGAETIKELSLIDGADENTHVKSIGFSKVPSISVNDKGYVVKTFDSADTSFSSTVFPTLLNAGPSDLKIDYEIGLGAGGNEMWLDVSELMNRASNQDESTELSVDFGIFIALPIELTVKQNESGYAALDIMGIISSFSSTEEGSEGESSGSETQEEKDLLGRESASTDSVLNTVLDYIEKVALKIGYTNNTGMALKVVISDTNDAAQKFEKELTLGKGTGTIDISLNSTDAEYMMSTYPFYPDKFEIQIPGSKTSDTVYNIKRELGFNVSLSASVDAKVDYTLSFNGTN